MDNDLFPRPDFYPTWMDFESHTATFVRMTPEDYRSAVFLDKRAKYGSEPVSYRVDDIVLAGANVPTRKRTHLILNTAYCCSTLLARYLEAIPFCFVLKEPSVLAQVAMMQQNGDPNWLTALEVVMKLLTRTFEPDQIAVIKPYEPCNRLGMIVLEKNSLATATFLMTSLRSFLLSILKLEERRDWVRRRSISALKEAEGFRPFRPIEPTALSTAQAAACVWMANRFLYKELKNQYVGRVVLIDGDEVARSPRNAIEQILSLCGAFAGMRLIDDVVGAPTFQQYSKDIERPFDGASREQQLNALERCWGEEVSSGESWASGHGLSELESE